MVTTLGLFSVVFLFNVIMFGLTIKWYMGGDVNKQVIVSEFLCTYYTSKLIITELYKYFVKHKHLERTIFLCFINTYFFDSSSFIHTNVSNIRLSAFRGK